MAAANRLPTISRFFQRLFGAWRIEESPKGVASVRAPRPYLNRKRSLPRHFTAKDWDICLTYWNHQCAICERPRGLWHTLAQDHWIPLTHPECPGTLPTNILPLCHGEGGCNNSKGKKMPIAWLQEKLGKRRAARKLSEIQAYFGWVEAMRLGCPACGAHVAAPNEGQLHCETCSSNWDASHTAHLVKCPACGCLMGDFDGGGYYCPRCEDYWHTSQLTGIEWCPGCQTGILDWLADGGYWRCHKCGSEWEEDTEN